MQRDIYETITNRILAALEAAQADLEAGRHVQLPWVRNECGTVPTSIYGAPYRGVNYFLLTMLAGVYPSQLFGTYRGWQQKGCQVRKGEKGIPVIFWKFLSVREADTGETKDIPFARTFTVFAAEQVEGFDMAKHFAAQYEAMPNIAVRMARADMAVKAFCDAQGLLIDHGGNRAFYSPALDKVQMPLQAAFRSTEGYYATLLHELAHSTGHQKRMNRNFKGRFGDAAYAMEELVAEFAAAMMCARLGVQSSLRDDHTLYIASWLRVLRSNPKAAVQAAAQAQRAADMVLGGMVEEKETDDESELAQAA